nr:response regulator [Spirochaetaceae bacterium]
HRHHKSQDGSDLYIQISVYKTQVRDQQVMFAVSSDITQRIKAEEEKNQLQEQLNQIQKLESIGQLAGGIAHDFNNQLAGIMGYAEMLNPKLDDETLIHYANKIRQGVQNGAKLTQQLLSFARKGQYSLEIMDLHDILNETEDILSRTIDKRIEIIQARNVPSPTIRGDRHQIQNAILNIALNARDAIQGSGTITLESNLIDLDKKYKDHPVDLQAGKYIALTIKDDGMGMDAAVQKHIFEPFFTTKEFGKGTGMGLPAAYGTVRHHGGDLFVDSAPQRGSVFHILLPYTEEEYKKQPKGLEPIVMAVKDSRILIVDDDESIRDLLSKLLKNIGYRVYQAEDGKKGLTTYLDNREEIDLIILDMIMPNQGGEELYYSLQKINPKVKIILSSGYSNKDNSISNIVDQGTPFIQKPYSLGKLSKVVAEILGKE